MAHNRLFNVAPSTAGAPPSAPSSGAQPQPASPAPGPVGIITAQQSAITFAGAPAAVTVVWKVLGVAVPALSGQRLFPIVLSLIVGMLIYWQSASFNTTKEKVLGFLFALINCFAIAAATLGIDTAVGGGGAVPS